MKFYRCAHCGNIIAYVENSGVPVVCCGEVMKELIAGSSDGAAEKHVPVYRVENGIVTVTVGSAAHPMTEEHHIQWVALQTACGNQRKQLTAGGEPAVSFALTEGDSVISVYAYCNLHGLWVA